MDALFDDDNPEIWEQTRQHYEQAKTHYTRLIQPFIDLAHYNKANPDTILGSQPINQITPPVKNLTKQLLLTRHHVDQLPRHELSHLVMFVLEEIADKITQQPTQYTVTRQPWKHGTTLHILSLIHI